jgi:hypothetical protein
MAKKTRALRSAFITTLTTAAITATMASGCETFDCHGTDLPVGTSCNPPFVSCPEERPEAGDACELEVGSCDYEGEDGTDTATCGEDGTWTIELAAPCPDEIPTDAESCEDSEREGDCHYVVATACGEEQAIASCGYNYGATERTWHVEEPACNAE